MEQSNTSTFIAILASAYLSLIIGWMTSHITSIDSEGKKHKSTKRILLVFPAVFGIATIVYLTSSCLSSLLTNSIAERIEGYWLEEFIDENRSHQVSIAHISFNPKSGTLMYEGRGYDSNGETLAHWTSESVVQINDKPVFHLSYKGSIFDEQGQTKQDDVLGIAVLHFRELEGNLFSEGNGYFQESTPDMSKVRFEMVRITPEDCNELIGKQLMTTPRDEVDFIRKYVERRLEMQKSIHN